jgi:mannosylfructose-phosphate synthase
MHEHLGDFITNFLSAVHSRNIQYDVVNSHYWDAGWAGQKIAEELRIPHIHTPHSLGSWKQREMDGDDELLEQKYRLKERIHKEFLVYRSYDHLIATTIEQLENLQADYDLPTTNITVIPPGVDENRFTPVQKTVIKTLRKDLGVPENTIYAVGRMAVNKGYDLLIQSLPTVLRLVPNAHLLLAAGEENSTRDREKMDELKQCSYHMGIYDQITWADYIEDSLMADYHRAASVFALSSRYEPFGMTAIEAMA